MPFVTFVSFTDLPESADAPLAPRSLQIWGAKFGGPNLGGLRGAAWEQA